MNAYSLASLFGQAVGTLIDHLNAWAFWDALWYRTGVWFS